MEAVLGELRRDPEGVLPADCDECVDAKVLEIALDPFDAALDLDRVGTRGSEDGAAPRQDAAHRRNIEGSREPFERTLPAITESDEFVAVLLDASADHRADNCVQPWAVAPTREHSNAHDRSPSAPGP